MKRIILILVDGGEEPFAGAIGDRIDSIGIDSDIWLIESLNPVVSLSAELDPKLLDFTSLAKICRMHGCRFFAAYGEVEFGVVGTGTRMSYGSVTPLWSKLIAASFRLRGLDSWLTKELGIQVNGSECKSDDSEFYRIG